MIELSRVLILTWIEEPPSNADQITKRLLNVLIIAVITRNNGTDMVIAKLRMA